jgi:NADPH:quinone reductase-like Zn-dependent oxidoreductase
MKAIVFTEYGPPEVLKVKEIAVPVPKDNEILIRTRATTVKYGDLVARNFKNIPASEFNMPFLFWFLAKIAFGINKPKTTILGSEFSGTIESVGKNVKHFEKGNQIFGYTGQKFGAYAEYFCIPENGCVALKPNNISHEEAAVLPYGSIMAINLLRKAKITSGSKVMIIGASGGIGSAAVLLAKSQGAEVTGVCSAQRVEFVKLLGADRIVDYTKEDIFSITEKFDLIFDVLGRGSFSKSKKILKPNGRYIYASFKTKQMFQMLWTSFFGKQKAICALAPGSVDDLKTVKELIENGELKGIIDKRFPLIRAAEAHRYVENGSRKGNVVLFVE